MHRAFFVEARLLLETDKTVADCEPADLFLLVGEIGALPFPVHRVDGTGAPSWFVRRYLVPQALQSMGLDAGPLLHCGDSENHRQQHRNIVRTVHC